MASRMPTTEAIGGLETPGPCFEQVLQISGTSSPRVPRLAWREPVIPPPHPPRAAGAPRTRRSACGFPGDNEPPGPCAGAACRQRAARVVGVRTGARPAFSSRRRPKEARRKAGPRQTRALSTWRRRAGSTPASAALTTQGVPRAFGHDVSFGQPPSFSRADEHPPKSPQARRRAGDWWVWAQERKRNPWVLRRGSSGGGGRFVPARAPKTIRETGDMAGARGRFSDGRP